MTSATSALLSLALRLGRWVLERILRTGAAAAAAYLAGKAEDFERRADRRCSPLRREWLTERASEWRHAADSCRSDRLTARACDDALSVANERGIPRVADIERFTRWRRARESRPTTRATSTHRA